MTSEAGPSSRPPSEGKTTKETKQEMEKEYDELLKKVNNLGKVLQKPKSSSRRNSKSRVSISEDSELSDWTTATSGSESTDTDSTTKKHPSVPKT